MHVMRVMRENSFHFFVKVIAHGQGLLDNKQILVRDGKTLQKNFYYLDKGICSQGLEKSNERNS